MNRLTSTAVAALLAAPFAFAQPVLAQSSDDSSTGSDSSMSGDQTQETSGDQSSDASSGEADPVLVTVGGTEIVASDVTAAVAALPAQMQQTPAEQLVPFVVEQLVLRELILQDAEAQGISGDTGSSSGDTSASSGSGDDSSSDDTSASSDASGSSSDSASSSDMGQSSQMAQENATIEAYMEQQMERVVTDDAVQSAYDEVASTAQTEIPPLEAVRPQIEQQLRQQRLAELRDELMQDVEIVYYGPDGEPRENMTDSLGASSGGGMSSGSSDSGSMDSSSGSSSDSGSTDSSSGGSSDSGSMDSSSSGSSDSDSSSSSN